jgi:hypothetical protein
LIRADVPVVDLLIAVVLFDIAGGTGQIMEDGPAVRRVPVLEQVRSLCRFKFQRLNALRQVLWRAPPCLE